MGKQSHNVKRSTFQPIWQERCETSFTVLTFARLTVALASQATRSANSTINCILYIIHIKNRKISNIYSEENKTNEVLDIA